MLKKVVLNTAAGMFALLLAVGHAPAATPGYKGFPAKYVFFFIGDGMGIAQRTAAEKYAAKRLLIDEFPAQGITTTFAANRFITGSAAAATALACGQKTSIGMLGMAPDGQKVKSIAELAGEKGMKVGIVSSVSIDHATPASFYAHVPKRSQYYDIDVALAESGFNFFGGGGLKDPANKRDNATEFKGDALGLIKNAGYKIVRDRESFWALKPADGKVIAWNAWLQDSKALPYRIDMTAKDITLPQFTAKAIEMLDNPKGFFLMVEGGKIDWACHANDATAAVTNTLSFDKAVREAVKFAETHPRETLIVVTGDHECGGLTLGFAGTKYASDFDILNHQKVSFQKFTAEILSRYRENCGGKCSFGDMQPIITANFGLKFSGDPKTDPMVLEPYQVEILQGAYRRTMSGKKRGPENIATYLLYGGYDPLAVSLTHVLNNKAGLGWTSYKHTGVPVSTSAMGVGAGLFNGYYDNTDVALKIMLVMGITPQVHYAEAAAAGVRSTAKE